MKNQRFYALDLLRTCAIIVVSFYHMWESSFGENKMIFKATESVFGLLTPFFLDYWGYSGLILALVSFFLIGYSATKFNWRRYLLVFIGLVGMIIHDQAGFDVQTWNWNLYAYLLFSLLFVQILPKNRNILFSVSLICLVSLLIPIEQYQTLKPHLSSSLAQIMIGDLDIDTTIGWGLLPWLAIPTLGFCIGRLLRSMPQDSWVFKGFKFEIPALLTLATMLIVAFPFNPDISISTTGFYYYVFSGSLWFFWSRFLVVFIWIRLACKNSVNEYLSKFKWVRWISDLAWNKYFGLCYFIQLLIVPLAAEWSQTFRTQPLLMDITWLGILIGTELIARSLVVQAKLASNKLARGI
ncbi:hypothetical protein B9G69_007770 [Bdellovibrio sp. SKB1291214]|uniref:hypothetical protein n=1 Tax=Bdellovibrio sp. SKB1291214 TaxID=1732569 RepID=UPI000B51AC6E|nr:hypothetical protein [Bdellovibrio sp. SKB1291214]UYL10473.1 hypothetical protein B9G69_007770 [Bdellovibrio sp. SKB1291214]